MRSVLFFFLFTSTLFALAAERGLMEMRKLNLEQQLWDVSRKDLVAEAAAAAAVAAIAAGPPKADY